MALNRAEYIKLYRIRQRLMGLCINGPHLMDKPDKYIECFKCRLSREKRQRKYSQRRKEK